MNTLRLYFLSILATTFFIANLVCAQADTISIGGVVISLPSPVGYYRYDGKSKMVDNIERRLAPASNQLLAQYGTEETLAEVLLDHYPKGDRHFSAQSVRNLQSTEITGPLFTEAKPGLRSAYSSENQKEFSSLLKEIEANAYAAVSARITIGEMIPLGVFDETNDSLCFSMLGKVQAATISQTYVTIVAGCIVRVRNRVLLLFSSSPYRNKSDIEWARLTIKHWRDAVLKANAQ